MKCKHTFLYKSKLNSQWQSRTGYRCYYCDYFYFFDWKRNIILNIYLESTVKKSYKYDEIMSDYIRI